MSMLALAVPTDSAAADTPRILSFLDSTTRESARIQQDVVSRARLLHQNTTCHNCGRTTVDPVELDDAQLNRWGLMIPGTATVIGFSCNACGNEWSASQPALSIYG